MVAEVATSCSVNVEALHDATKQERKFSGLGADVGVCFVNHDREDPLVSV